MRTVWRFVSTVAAIQAAMVVMLLAGLGLWALFSPGGVAVAGGASALLGPGAWVVALLAVAWWARRRSDRTPATPFDERAAALWRRAVGRPHELALRRWLIVTVAMTALWWAISGWRAAMIVAAAFSICTWADVAWHRHRHGAGGTAV
ncbi:MAG: hypothetical protein ACLFXM_13810 [Acidimicrobiia bacterium]